MELDCMKTTLEIPDTIFRRAKTVAAEFGRSALRPWPTSYAPKEIKKASPG